MAQALTSNVDDSGVTQLEITGSALGSALMRMLNATDIEPGSDLSYQLAKDIYVYHPLGGKMVDAPIAMAQSKPREITVQDAPDDVAEAFIKQWDDDGADSHIANLARLSRIYGLGSIVAGCEGVDSSKPLDMTKIWDLPLFFNPLDPLNTAGSLVLNQIPTSPNFLKPTHVESNGQVYHPSRSIVLMNEAPIFLSYTTSAFGFVGRSVFQRALFPLKSYVRTMIANDMIAMKLGVLIIKRKPPGSVLDKVMKYMYAAARWLLKMAQTGQVLNVGIEDSVETLNMQNVEGAGEYSRSNIIKDCATAGDMPAVLLENETLAEGFGEGSEDAKRIAQYGMGFRRTLKRPYTWFDNITRYRAWNPAFFQRMQRKYPKQYGGMSYEEAFSQWRANFSAEWPSLIEEPESERVKVEDVKLQGVIAYVQTFRPLLDPPNQALLLQWAANTIKDNKIIFPRELNLDWESVQEFLEDQQAKQDEAAKAALAAGGQEDGAAQKLARFDSAQADASLQRFSNAAARLPPSKRFKALQQAH